MKGTKEYLIQVSGWFDELYGAYSKRNIKLAVKTHKIINQERSKLFNEQNQNLIFGTMIDNMFSLAARIISILI